MAENQSPSANCDACPDRACETCRAIGFDQCWRCERCAFIKPATQHYPECNPGCDATGHLLLGEAVEITEVEFARAFVALYEAIDGVVDEMSERDFRLTQENWPLYLHAKEFLTSVTTPGATPRCTDTDCAHDWCDNGPGPRACTCSPYFGCSEYAPDCPVHTRVTPPERSKEV